MQNETDSRYEEYQKHFNDQNYVLVKNFITKELATFIFNYGVMRHNRARFMIENNWPFYRQDDGTLADGCVQNSYCCYGDPVMETVLALGLKGMQQITGTKLIPQYSYWRLYKKGDALHRHKDRMNCEFAASLCFGYAGQHQDQGWPIYVEASGGTGLPGKAINMEAGDMIVYKGHLVEHWREPFEGDYVAQAFLFYNDVNGSFGQQQFDGRPMLGLPFNFAKRDVTNDTDDAQ